MFCLKDLTIVVPSYKRAGVFRDTTLRILTQLKENNSSLKPINVFLENEEELEEYKKVLDELVSQTKLEIIYHITNTQGIAEKRNAMKKYYYDYAKENKKVLYVLFIDDDIQFFSKKNDTKLMKIDLKEIIINGFNETIKNNLNYWGINNLQNGMFLKDEVSTKLKYLQGGFVGEIIYDELERPTVDIQHYEDYEYCIKYYLRDRGVVRLNNYCLKTRPWRDGGINASFGGLAKRKATMEGNCKYLMENYGGERNLLTIKTRSWGLEPFLNWRHSFNVNDRTLLVIPSIGRSDNIITLKNNLCENLKNIDIKIITNPDQIEDYKNKYDSKIEVVGCPLKGIGITRYWILDKYSKEYDYIVMVDDDILELNRVRGVGDDKVLIPFDLNTLIVEMRHTLDKRKAYFGGINLCPNVFYAKDQISNKLKYISGAIQIHRSSDKPIPKTSHRHFEDFVYNIEYFKRDGIIVRWDGVLVKTNNYNPVGGICSDYGSLELRLKDAEIVADLIVKKYGENIVKKVYKKKTSRNPECVNLRLNHHYKNTVELNFY